MVDDILLKSLMFVSFDTIYSLLMYTDIPKYIKNSGVVKGTGLKGL